MGFSFLARHPRIGEDAPMLGRLHRIACVAACLVAAAALAAADPPDPTSPGPLTAEAARRLDLAVGDPDPSIGSRLAAALTAEQITAAMYAGTRGERIVAIDAAEHLADPWPILPHLAAFLRAPERAAASQAAASLLGALARVAGRPSGAAELVPGQADQLVRTLLDAAKDDVLATDLRVAALQAIRLLAEIAHRPFPPPEPLLRDAEPAVTSAAIALLAPPLAEGSLAILAEIAGKGADPLVRGQAVGALCENALHHGVAAPSADLAKLIRGVFVTSAPAASLLPALACVSRFPPAARSGLVDLALAHPDPAVQRFWESAGSATVTRSRPSDSPTPP
jgi:hypothetical protein